MDYSQVPLEILQTRQGDMYHHPATGQLVIAFDKADPGDGWILVPLYKSCEWIITSK